MGLFLRKMRVALTPRSWRLRTTLRNGAKVEGYNRAGWGGRGVYIYRDLLEPELAVLEQLLQPGDVFVDVGANVGVFSMKAARCVGESGLVVAVEPFVGSARQVMENVELNGLTNVRVRNVCMGGQTGEMKFYLNNGHPNAFALKKIGDAQELSVLCVTLDDLAGWERLERLDYLKIDAEGAERVILEGGAETIARFRPMIQAECSIAELALPEGYRSFRAKPELENRDLPASNRLLVPEAKVEMVKALGWLEAED